MLAAWLNQLRLKRILVTAVRRLPAMAPLGGLPDRQPWEPLAELLEAVTISVN